VSNHESKLARLRAELARRRPERNRAREEHSNLFFATRGAGASARRPLRLQRGSRGRRRALERGGRRNDHLRRSRGRDAGARSHPLRGAAAQVDHPGGRGAGVGIEASSFRYGLVHDTLLALDVLLADGSIVTCTRTTSTATVLRVSEFLRHPRLRTEGHGAHRPREALCAVEHVRHADPKAYFADLEARCRAKDADFIDGTVFSAGEMVSPPAASPIRRPTRATTPTSTSITARSASAPRTTSPT